MPDLVKACALADIPPGECRALEVDGKDIALFNVDGTIYALSNSCPHLGGPLGKGSLEGPVVTCPWHNWRFDVRNGELVTDDGADVGIECYEVKVEGGEIWVKLID